MNQYIKDPLEIMESAIERQMGMVDEQGSYPCCICGARSSADDMITISENPASPLCHEECLEGG